MRQAARMYMETQVTTTSQGQILIMLYDGAIKFLNQAKELIRAKDYAGKGKLISSAIDVINELASSLNAEKGGDLAANLNQLYFYCNKRLFMANSRMDVTAIDEVIKILSGIRSAYAQIIDTPEAIAAMAQATPPTPKGPRAPVGAQSAQAGAPVSAAKVRNAYATQSAAVANGPAQEAQPLESEDRPAADAVPAPEASAPQAAPEREPAAASAPIPAVPDVEEAAPLMPETPDLDFGAPTPPPINQAKRMAASNLYRKFAS